MKLKQKISIAPLIFGLVAGLMSALFATTAVFAQVSEPCLGLEGQALEDCMRTNSPPEPEEETCNPAEEKCCGDVETSIIGGDVCAESEEGGVIFGILKGVLIIMTAGIGIAAVGGIAYGALLYTTAENKPDQTKKAIGIITNVVIGLVAYALMAVLLNFLIPGGIFIS